MYSCLTLMISTLLACVVGGHESGPVYTVEQLIGVSHSGSFTCRVRDYAWPTAARFTVRVRNIEESADPNAAFASRRYLHERLINARQVKLVNVQDHGYFRLTADVWVDGSDVAAQMVEYGLVQLSAAPVSPPPLKARAESSGLLWVVDPPAEYAVKRPASPVVLSEAALEKRLSQVADLSRIGPETTFEDALTMLSEASEPKLPLLILWNDLERNAFVRRDIPIGISGFGQMRLDKALALILRSGAPSGPPLIVAAEGGVLTIASRYAGLNKPRTGVYPAADLLAAPSEDRSELTGGVGGASMR